MPQGDPRQMPTLPAVPEGWHLGTPDLVLEDAGWLRTPGQRPRHLSQLRDSRPISRKTSGSGRSSSVRARARSCITCSSPTTPSGAAGKLDGAGGQAGLRRDGRHRRRTRSPGARVRSADGRSARRRRSCPTASRWPLPKGSDLDPADALPPDRQGRDGTSTVGHLLRRQGAGAARLLPADAGTVRIWRRHRHPGRREGTTSIEDSLDAAGGRQGILGRPRTRITSPRTMKATATLPDGTTQPLLWIQDWDFNWQDRYIYKAPVVAAEGHAHRRAPGVRQLGRQPAQSRAARRSGSSGASSRSTKWAA